MVEEGDDRAPPEGGSRDDRHGRTPSACRRQGKFWLSLDERDMCMGPGTEGSVAFLAPRAPTDFARELLLLLGLSAWQLVKILSNRVTLWLVSEDHKCNNAWLVPFFWGKGYPIWRNSPLLVLWEKEEAKKNRQRKKSPPGNMIRDAGTGGEGGREGGREVSKHVS